MVSRWVGGITAIRDNRVAKILVTGGAGFIGRWVTKKLIDKGGKIWILDNLSNGTENNIKEFRSELEGFVRGDIRDKVLLSGLFKEDFDACIHLAAAINVQESIDNPGKCFEENVAGTFNVLDECRRQGTTMVFMSSALVYETARHGQTIKEDHPLNPSSPYTASKISGEQLVTSYSNTYDLPIVILRPFSIYGPWQRRDSDGGVVSIFIDRKLKGEPIEVFGNGEQSRDFLYVEDCAGFIVEAALSSKALGHVFNAGAGEEVKIKDLAEKIGEGRVDIRFVKHHHPEAEVMSLRADSRKAKEILGWQATTNLAAGLIKTADWLQNSRG